MEARLKMTDSETSKTVTNTNSKKRNLPAAAQRALKEAEERRQKAQQTNAPKEIGGRGGNDPSRYGDWEIKGRTIDF